VHLVRAQDQLALVLEEEGGAQGIVEGCLLGISDCLNVFKLLGIPQAHLAGERDRDDLELSFIETNVDNLIVVCFYLFNLILARPIHNAQHATSRVSNPTRVNNISFTGPVSLSSRPKL
jgi:hypothetical protein